MVLPKATLSLPKKLHKLSEIARAVALSSKGVGGRKGDNFRVGAILFDKKGRVIRAKTNSLKSHPYLSRFTPHPYLHAEQAAILAQGLENCDGLNLLVVRVRKDGTIGSAEPCSVCKKILGLSNVNKVYYSNNEGLIERI